MENKNRQWDNELTLSSKIVNGEEVETAAVSLGDICSCKVEVGTNGFHGGDTGHGGRTYFSIANTDCSDISAAVTMNGRGAEIEFSGDAELEIFIDALDFASYFLRKQLASKGNKNTKVERQERFNGYLNALVELYKKNQSLNGMSKVASRFHVTAITKEQFYLLALHMVTEKLGKEYTNEVYDYVLGKSSVLPIAPFGQTPLV